MVKKSEQGIRKNACRRFGAECSYLYLSRVSHFCGWGVSLVVFCKVIVWWGVLHQSGKKDGDRQMLLLGGRCEETLRENQEKREQE